MARRPMTEQERIDAKTLAIEDPTRIIGSGFIQFPPQRPFERPLTVQPATIAKKEYDDLERVRSGGGGGGRGGYAGGPPSHGGGGGRGRGPHMGGGRSSAPNGSAGQHPGGGHEGGGPAGPARYGSGGGGGGGREGYRGGRDGYRGGGRGGGGGRGYGRGMAAPAPVANGISHATPAHAAQHVQRSAALQQGPPQHSVPQYSQSRPPPVEAVAAQLKDTVIQDKADGGVSKLSRAQRQRLRKKMREVGQE